MIISSTSRFHRLICVMLALSFSQTKWFYNELPNLNTGKGFNVVKKKKFNTSQKTLYVCLCAHAFVNNIYKQLY